MEKERFYLISMMQTNVEKEFEMDDIQTCRLDNQAHKVIYESLFDKFQELLQNRSRFYDESTSLYKEALQKYGKE